MNDRAVNLLEQYDVEVLKTRKGRGAILCETSRGCLIFKEYAGNEEKLATTNMLLTHLQQTDCVRAECILPTKEGSLYVKDYDGVKYLLKTYAEGRECNISDRTECMEAVKLLAKLHSCMEFEQTSKAVTTDVPYEGMIYANSSGKEYEKRNRELKKVRKYLKQRSQKSWFEIQLQQYFDVFLEQALDVTAQWEEYEQVRLAKESENNRIAYCHGDYQYHNLLKTNQGWFIINFEKCVQDDPVRDLYLFMRKLLEKSNWSVSLGRELLAAYEAWRPLSAISRIDLYYRLAYPEKFWKIANLEKLEKLVEQEPAKQQLLDELFRTM